MVSIDGHGSFGLRLLGADAGGPAVRTGWIVVTERLIFLAVLSILATTAYFWSHPVGHSAFREHGTLENVQIILLVVAALVLVPAVRVSAGVTRTISMMFLIAMVTGVIRELEVKSIRGPAWWNWLTDDFSLQEILLFAGAFTLLAYIWTRRADVPAIFRRSLHPYSIPLQLGVVVAFIGAYATEKLIRKGPFSLVAEEMLETAGYLLILVGILRTLDKALDERRSLGAIV